MSVSLESVIGKDAVTRLLSSNGLIHGLPGTAYISEALFELEFERLFAPSWVYLGHAHETPDPGDAQPLNFFGLPVLLARNMAGEVRAFHNVCRHRGTRLINKKCSGLKSFVCPYHGWTYELDGALKANPHFAGHRQMKLAGFDPKDFGLKSLRCDVWGDWVFVNPSGDAPPLLDYIEPLVNELGGFTFDNLAHFLTLDFGEVPANWKLILENSLENYHVPVVHAKTASGHPLKDHFSIVNGHCIGSGIDIRVTGGRSNGGRVQSDQGPGTLDMSARYLVLLPNLFMVTYHPDIVMTRLLLPVSATRSIFQVRAYSTTGKQPSKQVIDDWRRLVAEVEEEDIRIHREQQAGRTSPVTVDGGVLSPAWEQSVRAFHEHLLDKLS